jgi:bifunctional UDP-N-acetylglucosamine pyrophosphorylase/glucosamine-1-phosphate N-acetyltransferase
VIVKNVPPGALAVSRGQQRNVDGWVERKRAGSAAAQAAAEPAASLAEEWDRYLAGVPVEGYDRDRLAAMGRAAIERVEEEVR